MWSTHGVAGYFLGTCDVIDAHTRHLRTGLRVTLRRRLELLAPHIPSGKDRAFSSCPEGTSPSNMLMGPLNNSWMEAVFVELLMHVGHT